MSLRTFLYVPGDRQNMLAKALTLGADAVVADLEDAVSESRKSEARRTVVDWLHSLPAEGPQVWVRVNALQPLVDDDLAALNAHSRLSGIFVPKANRRTLEDLTNHLPNTFNVIPLVESADALVDISALAKAPLVSRMGIGEADLVATLGMEPSPDRRELTPIRLQLVVASAAAGIEPPLGPAYTAFRDLAGLEESTIDLRRMGFGARTAIHPAQLEIINRVFTPHRADVERARRMLKTSQGGTGVYVDDEKIMVDRAVLRNAHRIIALARKYGTRQ